MRVLGVSDNHNAGAALVVDGRLVAALNEERIIRQKNALAFPTNAIHEVLRLGGVQACQVDRVVVAGEITPSCPLRLLHRLHQGAKNVSGQFGLLFNLYTYYQVAARRLRWPYAADRALSLRWLTRRLRVMGFTGEVVMREHHQAHAESAFLCGPFERALAITADAMGDGVTATVSLGHPDGRVERLFAQSGLAALNPYYSRVTELLGFIPNRHEGKVTGLAAYGDPQKLAPLFQRTLRFEGDRFTTLGNPWRHHRLFGWYRHLVAESREDIAAACQRVLEEAVTAFVDHWVRRTGVDDIVLAGGIFENVKLNQRVRELPGVHRVSVFPNMSDGGLAAGAALAVAGALPAPLPTVYLGTAYDEEAIRRTLEQEGVPFTRPDDLADAVAALLVERQVVPRFVGRMEYGPRALGNRTIYYRADEPAVNDWLNQRLRRSEFMPFAPAVLEAAATRCFVGFDKAEFTARFMNMCFDCTDYMKRVAPGCVHVDGTARPQIVRREDNADAFAVLSAYERRTGVPVLINTSFNMHEEPIVMTPLDAVRSIRAAGLRYLAIGPFLATNGAP
jgi:carbamoyltransferase